MIILINITNQSHEYLKEFINPNISVDMTCGRGNDTLFLSRISKKVYAFDIQNEAIQSTNVLLKKNHRTNVEVIKDSHDLFDLYISEKIDLFIYNLGYLPSSTREVKTNARIVLSSLEKALDFLTVSGMIVIVVYLHDFLESRSIETFVSKLGKSFDVSKFQILNKKNSPYIIKIKKVQEQK